MISLGSAPESISGDRTARPDVIIMPDRCAENTPLLYRVCTSFQKIIRTSRLCKRLASGGALFWRKRRLIQLFSEIVLQFYGIGKYG